MGKEKIAIKLEKLQSSGQIQEIQVTADSEES